MFGLPEIHMAGTASGPRSRRRRYCAWLCLLGWVACGDAAILRPPADGGAEVDPPAAPAVALAACSDTLPCPPHARCVTQRCLPRDTTPPGAVPAPRAGTTQDLLWATSGALHLAVRGEEVPQPDIGRWSLPPEWLGSADAAGALTQNGDVWGHGAELLRPASDEPGTSMDRFHAPIERRRIVLETAPREPNEITLHLQRGVWRWRVWPIERLNGTWEGWGTLRGERGEAFPSVVRVALDAMEADLRLRWLDPPDWVVGCEGWRLVAQPDGTWVGAGPDGWCELRRDDHALTLRTEGRVGLTRWRWTAHLLPHAADAQIPVGTYRRDAIEPWPGYDQDNPWDLEATSAWCAIEGCPNEAADTCVVMSVPWALLSPPGQAADRTHREVAWSCVDSTCTLATAACQARWRWDAWREAATHDAEGLAELVATLRGAEQGWSAWREVAHVVLHDHLRWGGLLRDPEALADALQRARRDQERALWRWLHPSLIAAMEGDASTTLAWWHAAAAAWWHLHAALHDEDARRRPELVRDAATAALDRRDALSQLQRAGWFLVSSAPSPRDPHARDTLAASRARLWEALTRSPSSGAGALGIDAPLRAPRWTSTTQPPMDALALAHHNAEAAAARWTAAWDRQRERARARHDQRFADTLHVEASQSRLSDELARLCGPSAASSDGCGVDSPSSLVGQSWLRLLEAAEWEAAAEAEWEAQAAIVALVRDRLEQFDAALVQERALRVGEVEQRWSAWLDELALRETAARAARLEGADPWGAVVGALRGGRNVLWAGRQGGALPAAGELALWAGGSWIQALIAASRRQAGEHARHAERASEHAARAAGRERMWREAALGAAWRQVERTQGELQLLQALTHEAALESRWRQSQLQARRLLAEHGAMLDEVDRLRAQAALLDEQARQRTLWREGLAQRATWLADEEQLARYQREAFDAALRWLTALEGALLAPLPTARSGLADNPSPEALARWANALAQVQDTCGGPWSEGEVQLSLLEDLVTLPEGLTPAERVAWLGAWLAGQHFAPQAWSVLEMMPGGWRPALWGGSVTLDGRHLPLPLPACGALIEALRVEAVGALRSPLRMALLHHGEGRVRSCTDGVERTLYGSPQWVTPIAGVYGDSPWAWGAQGLPLLAAWTLLLEPGDDPMDHAWAALEDLVVTIRYRYRELSAVGLCDAMRARP